MLPANRHSTGSLNTANHVVDHHERRPRQGVQLKSVRFALGPFFGLWFSDAWTSLPTGGEFDDVYKYLLVWEYPEGLSEDAQRALRRERSRSLLKAASCNIAMDRSCAASWSTPTNATPDSLNTVAVGGLWYTNNNKDVQRCLGTLRTVQDYSSL